MAANLALGLSAGLPPAPPHPGPAGGRRPGQGPPRSLLAYLQAPRQFRVEPGERPGPLGWCLKPPPQEDRAEGAPAQVEPEPLAQDRLEGDTALVARLALPAQPG